MDIEIDRAEFLGRILLLISQKHDKMDGVTSSPELKAKAEGYIEALYQVESLILNWGRNE